MKLVISPEQVKALKESYESTPDSFEGENHHAPDFVIFNDTAYRWTDPDAIPFFVLSDGEIEYGEKGKRHADFLDNTFRSAFDRRNFVDDIILQGRYWESGNIFSFWYVDWDYFSGNGIIQILAEVCRRFNSSVVGAYLAYKHKTYVVAKNDDYYWLKEVENTKERRTLDQKTYDRIDSMFSSEVNYVKRTVCVLEGFGQTMVPRDLNPFEAVAAGCYRMASDFFHDKNSEFDKEDFRAYLDMRFKGRVTFDELIDYFSGTLRNRLRPKSVVSGMLRTLSHFDDDILDSIHRYGLSDVDMKIIPSDDGSPYSYNIYTTKIQSANRLCSYMVDSGYIVDRKVGKKVEDSNGRTFNIVSFRIRRPAQLNESKGYDMGEIGAVNCTLDFDEDEYQEWLQDNGAQDTPENKIQYIKDYCTYYVEYQDSETFHTFDHEDLSYDEILETFGEKMGNSIINDCMDGKEHSFETLEYVDNSEVNLNNPVELNAAAKQVMPVVDNPCGKFRGWILSDGTTLNAGWDHNACFKIDPNRIKYREDFTKLGNIRFSDVSLEFGKYPTHEQMEMVRMYCEYHQHDTIYVDFLSDKFGRQDTRYNGMDFSELSNDLYNYYTHGTLGRKRDYMYEGIDELGLYHGTHADFDQFKEEFYLTGVGEMAYGWGVYLSNSINTAKEYSPGGQIMTVEVPDGKYLDSRRISKKEASYLAKAFYKFYLNGKGGEIYKGSEQEFWDYECSCLENVPDGSYLYGTISTFLGSDKEASEWLHSMGYAGLRFPGHNANTGEKFMNYVIFDTNDVKIIKKTPNISESSIQPIDYNERLMKLIERRNGVELSEKGKEWFLGLINGNIFGLTMDAILEKAAFLIMGIKPFAVGQDVGNEWDELGCMLRLVIKKTGFGENIYERFRSLKGVKNRDFISANEWDMLEKKLQYYPDILKELKRCYHVFTVLAPAVYKVVNYLKKYEDGVPALEFCYLVQYYKEKGRATTNSAVSLVLQNHRTILPQIEKI